MIIDVQHLTYHDVRPPTRARSPQHGQQPPGPHGAVIVGQVELRPGTCAEPVGLTNPNARIRRANLDIKGS